MLGVLGAIMDAAGGSGPFNPTKITIAIEPKGPVKFPHLFNPTDLKIGRKVTWKCQPGVTSEGAKGSPYYVFGGGGDTLSFSCVLDCSEEKTGDLQQEISSLYDLNYPHTTADSSEMKRGQLVCVQWSKFVFTGVVDSVDITVNLFDPTGRMKRATVALAMQGYAFVPLDVTKTDDRKLFFAGPMPVKTSEYVNLAAAAAPSGFSSAIAGALGGLGI